MPAHELTPRAKNRGRRLPTTSTTSAGRRRRRRCRRVRSSARRCDATLLAMSGAASSLHPMSVEQWAALDEDEPGELVDGHLEEEEVPTWAHELVVSWLIRVLGGWIVPRGGF